MPATVSVVIPTYNSRDLLPEALDALAAQTMPSSEIEILVVDDGSTDGTWDYLVDVAAQRSNVRIFHQANSGRPSVGRNRALREASGAFVFFNDADDYLGPDALRRLVAVAERERSDVVIGRTGRIGKPSSQPPSTRTALDADLIEDNVWPSLSPHKLFRRSLIDRVGATFPEDMVQGEDQVFVASCLFAAAKVSVLRDDDYYFRRARDDGQNVSSQPQTLQNKLLTSTRMAALIVAHTSPGERRDALFERVLFRTLAPGLNHPFRRADPAERETFLSTIQRDVLPNLTPALLRRAGDLARLRLVTARLGTAEQLLELSGYLRRAPRFRVEGETLTYDLGPGLNALLNAEERRANELPSLAHQLVDVHRFSSGFGLRVIVEPQVPAADNVVLLARLRGSTLEVEADGAPVVDNGDSTSVTLSIRPDQLAKAARVVGLVARLRRPGGPREQRWDFVLRGRSRLVPVSASRLGWEETAVRAAPLGERPRTLGHRGREATVYGNAQGQTSLLLRRPRHRALSWRRVLGRGARALRRRGAHQPNL